MWLWSLHCDAWFNFHRWYWWCWLLLLLWLGRWLLWWDWWIYNMIKLLVIWLRLVLLLLVLLLVRWRLCGWQYGCLNRIGHDNLFAIAQRITIFMSIWMLFFMCFHFKFYLTFRFGSCFVCFPPFRNMNNIFWDYIFDTHTHTSSFNRNCEFVFLSRMWPKLGRFSMYI